MGRGTAAPPSPSPNLSFVDDFWEVEIGGKGGKG